MIQSEKHSHTLRTLSKLQTLHLKMLHLFLGYRIHHRDGSRHATIARAEGVDQTTCSPEINKTWVAVRTKCWNVEIRYTLSSDYMYH